MFGAFFEQVVFLIGGWFGNIQLGNGSQNYPYAFALNGTWATVTDIII